MILKKLIKALRPDKPNIVELGGKIVVKNIFKKK